MVFEVRLYTFYKETNSTAKPTDGTVYTGLLREPCGIINPTVSFEFTAGFCPAAYNYAYIPAFSRFYFVNDWTSMGRLWVCSMSVDALASWAEEIGLQNMYVLRSSAARNQYITDMMYPAKTSPDIVSEYKDVEEWSYSFSSGSYVVGFISSTPNGVGAVTYYGFTNSEFREFCNNLLSTTNWIGSVTEISDDLLKALFNPFQYIASCYWLPFSVTGTSVSAIPLGWNWSISANCTRLSGSLLYSFYLAFIVPPHPDWEEYGNYVHSAPFSQYEINVPPFGSFPLDANLVSQTEDVTATIDVDAVTGVGRLQVRGADYTFVDVSTQVGAPIQLAQSTMNISKVGDVISSAGRAVSSLGSGDLTGLISNAASGIVDAISLAGAPLLVSSGGNGGLAGLGPAKFTAVFYRQVSRNNRKLGSPLCETRRLDTIPGFLQILSPHADLPCTLQEKNMIEAFMESGFFLESGVD